MATLDTYAPAPVIELSQTAFQRSASVVLRRIREGAVGQVRIIDRQHGEPRVVAIMTAPEEADRG